MTRFQILGPSPIFGVVEANHFGVHIDTTVCVIED